MKNKGIFEGHVSYFDNYYTKQPTDTIRLIDWLTTDDYKQKINRLRKIQNKEERSKIKASLPAITPSGVFTGTRAAKNLTQHSGFIGVDIDQQDNEHLGSIVTWKNEIVTVPNVAYCGLSASGNGLFVLVPIPATETHNHRLYFEKLETYFLLRYGITIDKACKDVSRLRGASYDPDAYFNEEAVPLSILRPAENKRSFTTSNTNTDITIVNKILEAVLEDKIDITAGEANWFKLGCALASTFGEEGRAIFHKFSQFHSEYNEARCDKKYDNILKNDGYGFNLSPLIRLAKEYGLWDS